jgi:hypothetical protein
MPKKGLRAQYFLAYDWYYSYKKYLKAQKPAILQRTLILFYSKKSLKPPLST